MAKKNSGAKENSGSDEIGVSGKNMALISGSVLLRQALKTGA